MYGWVAGEDKAVLRCSVAYVAPRSTARSASTMKWLEGGSGSETGATANHVARGRTRAAQRDRLLAVSVGRQSGSRCGSGRRGSAKDEAPPDENSPARPAPPSTLAKLSHSCTASEVACQQPPTRTDPPLPAVTRSTPHSIRQPPPPVSTATGARQAAALPFTMLPASPWVRWASALVVAFFALHLLFQTASPSYAHKTSFDNAKVRLGLKDRPAETWAGGRKLQPWEKTPATAWPVDADGNDLAFNATRAQEEKVSATFVMLARNRDVWGAVDSIRGLEGAHLLTGSRPTTCSRAPSPHLPSPDRFNRRYHYTWTFLNDEPFSEEFKRHTSAIASSKTQYGVVPKEQWGDQFPEWIDEKRANEAIAEMGKKNIPYGGSVPCASVPASFVFLAYVWSSLPALSLTGPSYLADRRMCEWSSSPAALCRCALPRGGRPAAQPES